MDLSKLEIQKFANIKVHCGCGQEHTLTMDAIEYGPSMLSRAAHYAKKYAPDGNIVIVCDHNTYAACGARVEAIIKQNNDHVTVYTFLSEHDVVPSNREIGRLLIDLPINTALMVAVGSGVINDITRQVSYKMKIPYFVVCTAASMDGYASMTSSLVIDDRKSTIEGQLPKAILADEDVLQKAPTPLLRAGFGDVLGKLTGLADWDLSVKQNKEHRCDEIVKLVHRAVQECIDVARDVGENRTHAVKKVFDALLIAGLTMGLYKNTRPASGSEHHLAHYWDLAAIKKDRPHALHGESVGVATVIIARLYELAAERSIVDQPNIRPNKVLHLLKRAGAKITPSQIGIDKQTLIESIKNANELSWKYTILTHIKRHAPDQLEPLARQIAYECYD